jgi:outer membrane protein OmpA-like peptidoglycan-associated protein
MTRALLFVLTVHLLACGGSTPGAAKPGDGAAKPGEDAVGDAVAATPSDEAPTTSGRKTRDTGAFTIRQTDASSRPTQGRLKATDTEAAVRFFVVDKDKGPITGIVISLTAPTGEKYYTEETDADGFAEVLVPIGKTYDLIYLSLGRRNVASQVTVASEPRLNLKLTMRYKREDPPPPIVAIAPPPPPPAPDEPPPPPPPPPAPRFVLQGVQFDTGKATLTGGSSARLDTIVEYMTHKKSARIEISGHTDNVGNKKDNKKLSQQRADAVRAYLVSKGIDASRIQTVGYGDEQPIASNDTPEGRQQNRRIEAMEAM